MAGLPFTAEQQAAIDRREGPLLLAANAGSGKTSVLVERYVRMVLDDGIDPGAILAVTFTDRAAGEMRGRIRRELIRRDGHRFVAAAEAGWVSTLHGFCSRVLRQHALAAGVDPAFRLLEEGEQRELRERAFEHAAREFMASSANVELVAAFGYDQLREEIRSLYDLLRTRGMREPSVSPAKELSEPPDPAPVRQTIDAAIEHAAQAGEQPSVLKALGAAERMRTLFSGDDVPALEKVFASRPPRIVKALAHEDYLAYEQAISEYLQIRLDLAGYIALGKLEILLRSFASHYDRAKRARGVIDYPDLELLTRDLLVANPGLRDSYHERFARVMVDEFQDINLLQLELLELIDSGNTFVVGDEFQSIYGFRHADVGVFRARRALLSEHDQALVLPANFRSHPDLLTALNGVFVERFGQDFQPLAGGQDRNPLQRPRLELLLTQKDWDSNGDAEDRELAWREAEAELIAGRVAGLVDEGFSPRDIAVLVRAVGDMHLYESAIEARNIATLASGGRGFWARRQIRDLLAYLAALANPRDEIEFFALLASPLAQISSTGLVQIADAAASGEGRWDAIERGAEGLRHLSPADSARLTRFREWFEPLRRRTPQMSLSDLIDHAITGLAYDVHVLSLRAGRRRLANLFKLQRLAAEFEAVNGHDIRGFVDRARAELEAEAREPEAPVELGDADAVQLMTMHSAKGLEFPVVICADLGRQPMTSQPRVLIEGDRVGLRLPLVGGDPINTLDYKQLCEEAKARDAAEEDRVLYVAMTRAEELLIVSGGEKLDPWPEARQGCPPIRWLAPRLVADLQDQLAHTDVAVVPGCTETHVRLSVLTPNRAPDMLAVPGADPQGSLNISEFSPPFAAAIESTDLPVAGVPDRLSYTSVTSYGKCGYQYYLRRVLRMPEAEPGDLTMQDAPPSGLDPRVRGSIVHELLEAIDFADPKLSSPEEVRALAELMETEIDELGVTECLALVSAFIDGPLMPVLRTSTRLQRERGFTFSLGPEGLAAPLVNGYVDLIAYLPDGSALIIDYKTDQVEADTDLERVVAADYSVQRAIYALAALRGGAHAVEVVHLFLNRPDEPARARFTVADIGDLEAMVREQAAGLLAGDFRPTATPHRGLCATCPGRAALCRYGPEMTERELPG